MRTLVRVAAIPALAALAALAACGSDDPPAAPSTTSTVTTVPTTAAPTTAAPTTPAPTTAPPSAPSTTTEQPASGNVAEITVKVGVDDSPTRVERVRLGQEVVISLQSDEDEEYHLHGFDLEQKAAAGTEVALKFVADQPGRFELESHINENVLLILEVV
jgi:hypothetical protein